MQLWETDIEVDTEKGKVRLPIRLKRGLFQGDSSSPEEVRCGTHEAGEGGDAEDP